MSSSNNVNQVDPFDPSRFVANSTIVGDIGVAKEFFDSTTCKPDMREFVLVRLLSLRIFTSSKVRSS